MSCRPPFTALPSLPSNVQTFKRATLKRSLDLSPLLAITCILFFTPSGCEGVLAIYLLCFQIVAHSFLQWSHHKPFLINHFRTLSHAMEGGVSSLDPSLATRLPQAPRGHSPLATSLRFQRLTHCPICNHFILITLQQYPGVAPSARRQPDRKANVTHSGSTAPPQARSAANIVAYWTYPQPALEVRTA